MAGKGEKKAVTMTLSVRIKNCNTVLAEGFEPGVVATQELTYQVTKDELKSAAFSAEIDRQMELLRDSIIAVDVKENEDSGV